MFHRQFFLLVCSTTTEAYDSEKMAMEFLMQFPKQAFTVGQQLVFSFQDKKLLSLVVKELEGEPMRTRETLVPSPTMKGTKGTPSPPLR